MNVLCIFNTNGFDQILSYVFKDTQTNLVVLKFTLNNEE